MNGRLYSGLSRRWGAHTEARVATHIVCLTFDFDAMSGFIARGMTTPTPISRGEFGVVAAPRILDLLKLRGIASTWFIPGHTVETYPRICAEVTAAGHEIGHHGWTHVPPNDMSREQEAEGLARGIAAIERVCGATPRGYRSPSWDLSPHSIELLLAHGFYYDSSMMGHDWLPYRVRHGDVITLEQPAQFGGTTRLIEMPIAWSTDDYPHFEFLRTKSTILQGMMNANDVLSNWIDDFLYMKRNAQWGVLTYTMHPFVIGRGHRMLMLERLIERLAAEGACFMTMRDAARAYDSRVPFAHPA
ncbi:MAG: polysaccharide deacetylase [Burkholderiales bacterium]|nr:polysaccharide deacetylase [Burkholderiales bacterium]